MYHFFQAITNTNGDSLVGYFARVIDPTTGMVVTLASDANGTPIATVSGVADMGVTDSDGNISFYVAPGTYHLDIYNTDATTRFKRVQNVPMGAADPSAIAFTQSGTGAQTRTVEAKLRDTVSVKDFGAVGDGTTDDTAAFNLVTGAADVYSNALWRTIAIPAGIAKVTPTNSTIWVRKGQTLAGSGLGSTSLDMSAGVSNTQASIVLGKRSDNSTDSDGQAVEVRDMTIVGGSSTYPCIDATAPGGWKIHNLFFGGPGIGIAAGGTEGKVSGNIFDIGINHIVVTGANQQISDNLHYLGNYHITMRTGAADVTISGQQHEYFQYNAVLFDTGATGIKNVAIDNCNFIQATQYATSEAAISMRATAAEAAISNCRFRNLYGAGLLMGDTGSVANVSGCVFDGLKTLAGYAQSTTMRGVYMFGGTRLVVSCSQFKNLPGVPVEIGGSNALTVFVMGSVFSGNTGGAADIVVTNTNAASRIYVIGCRSDRTLISNTGSAVVENVPLTQTTGFTQATGTANKGAFAAYAGTTQGGTYSQADVQAADDAAKAASQRVKALEDAVRLAGIIVA